MDAMHLAVQVRDEIRSGDCRENEAERAGQATDQGQSTCVSHHEHTYRELPGPESLGAEAVPRKGAEPSGEVLARAERTSEFLQAFRGPLVPAADAGQNQRVTLGRGLLYGSSFALLALLSSWLALGPPSPWLLVLALFGYVSLIVWGVMTPRLQMFGAALCSVPRASGKLALTFDDGPDPASTPLVLDELKRANVRATFFMVGKKVEKYPDLAKRVVREGHELGAHSYDHNRMYAFLSAREVQADIQKTCEVIERAAGVVPRWFRPPVGQMSPPTAEGVERSGIRVAGWSVRSMDGLPSTTPETVIHRVLPRLRGGAIVLLHDALERETPGADPPAGVRALPLVLQACREKELSCVPLGELISDRPP